MTTWKPEVGLLDGLPSDLGTGGTNHLGPLRKARRALDISVNDLLPDFWNGLRALQLRSLVLVSKKLEQLIYIQLLLAGNGESGQRHFKAPFEC